MKRRTFLASAAAAATLFSIPARLLADGAKKKILYFERSTEYVHPATVLGEDGYSAAGRVLKKLGEQLGFEVICTKDGRLFDQAEQYDLFVFNCCGTLTEPKGEAESWPLSVEGEKKLFAEIRAGKGLLGFHSANDTNQSAGDPFETLPENQRTEYVRMIGGEFITHGAQAEAKLTATEPIQLPSLKALDKTFSAPMEEWYCCRNFAPDMHVLQIQETEGLPIDGRNHCNNRPPFPAMWVRMEGKGRVAYSSLAHNNTTWEAAWFQAIITDLLKLVSGKIDVDMTPNLNAVTPEANVLQR